MQQSLVLLVAAALACAPLSAQDAQTLSAGVARMDDGLARFELRRAERLVELSAASLDGELRPARSSVLWRGPWLAPATEASLSLARTDAGAWALASAIHGGATRFVHVWSGTGDPLAGAPVRFERVAGVLLPGEEREIRDVFSPQPFARDGRLQLVGAGCADGSRQLVWIAPLEMVAAPEGEQRLPLWPRLAGRAIGKGDDPRVALAGDDVLVAARWSERHVYPWGGAPVRFWRSADLVTWTVDEELSAGGATAAPAWDFAIDAAGVLRLATPTDARVASRAPTTGERPGITVLAWDRDAQEWRADERVVPAETPVRSERDRVRLLPAPGASGIELVYTAPDGALRRRAL